MPDLPWRTPSRKELLTVITRQLGKGEVCRLFGTHPTQKQLGDYVQAFDCHWWNDLCERVTLEHALVAAGLAPIGETRELVQDAIDAGLLGVPT